MEQAVDGQYRFAFKARSWTQTGIMLESELVPASIDIYDADVLLEAEDTSAGQIPQDGWVKVKLTATNIGTEIMSFRKSYCESDIFSTKSSDHELHDCDLSWLKPGASEDMELWIRVLSEDVEAGEVRRLTALNFNRMHGEGGKSLPPDASKEDAVEPAWIDGFYFTDTVTIVVPLLKEPETPQPAPQPLTHCVPALTGLGEGSAEWTLTRCPEHTAIAREANRLLEEADETDEARLTAREAVVRLWSDAMNAEYGIMTSADASSADWAAIEAEKAAFEAWLDARKAELEWETEDPAVIAEELAELLMRKTCELCCERHTSPASRADLRSAAAEELPAAGERPRCERTAREMGVTARMAEALCAEHRKIESLSAAAMDAEGWEQVKEAWLAALNAQTDARWLAADETGQVLIAEERERFGEWLTTREALLERLCSGRPAAVQELVVQAIRARVLENCED